MDNLDIEDLFRAVTPITIKRMFSGKGIYHQGVIFALYIFDEMWLKADKESAPEFEAAGAHQWVYQREGKKPVSTPYWTVPDAAYDDPDEMAMWVRLAYEAGVRAEAAKAAKGATARRKKSPSAQTARKVTSAKKSKS